MTSNCFYFSSAPVIYRRRAIGRIPAFDTNAGIIEYPLRQNTCLQVAITTIDANGVRNTVRNNVTEYDDSKLEESLRGAQAEVVQQEIFSVLIREASNLSTASARVSERLIVIDAAQSVELAFELVSLLDSYRLAFLLPISRSCGIRRSRVAR